MTKTFIRKPPKKIYTEKTVRLNPEDRMRLKKIVLMFFLKQPKLPRYVLSGTLYLMDLDFLAAFRKRILPLEWIKAVAFPFSPQLNQMTRYLKQKREIIENYRVFHINRALHKQIIESRLGDSPMETAAIKRMFLKNFRRLDVGSLKNRVRATEAWNVTKYNNLLSKNFRKKNLCQY